MLEKKSSEYRAKNSFLYSHVYRTNKMRGENALNNFSWNTLIERRNKLGKNRRKKVRKGVFYIRTITVIKIWGEKTRQTIFPETQE